MNEILRRLLFLPPQASSAAREVDTLHYLVIGTALLGATLVFAIALAFLIRYRRRDEAALTGAVRMPRVLEVGLIAGTLGMFLVFWVIGYRQYVGMRTPPRGALEIYVTGKQWMWKFAYPNGRSSLGVLAVPVGRPVRLIITSRDVIHSFFVPAFRIKQDAVPGRYLSTWFEAIQPGTYDVFCAEYCGASHSRMRAAVVALSAADYAAWLDDTRARDGGDDDFRNQPPGDLVEIGRRVAVRHACFACHTVDGQTHIGPSWRGLFGTRVALADGRTVLADESYLTRSMMDPRVELVSGYAPVMPTYLGLIEAPETAALVEYIKSLRGAATPSVMLPRVPPESIVVPSDASTATPEDTPRVEAPQAVEAVSPGAVTRDF